MAKKFLPSFVFPDSVAEGNETLFAAGTNVTLALTATDIPHDITIEGVGHIAHATRGKTTRGGVNVKKPGTYVFYCSVQGHRAAGMTGKIIVS